MHALPAYRRCPRGGGIGENSFRLEGVLCSRETGADVRSIPARSTRCHFGVATRDATPPLNAYGRWWGAALHDQKRGVHRPLLTSAAVFAPIGNDGEPLVLVTIDNCVFAPQDERALRSAICDRAALSEAQLLLTPSHSHSSANINTALPQLPGEKRPSRSWTIWPARSAMRFRKRAPLPRQRGSPGATGNAPWPGIAITGMRTLPRSLAGSIRTVPRTTRCWPAG